MYQQKHTRILVCQKYISFGEIIEYKGKCCYVHIAKEAKATVNKDSQFP